MWTPFRTGPSLPADVQALFARTLELLGVQILKWRGAAAVLQRRDRVFEYNVFDELGTIAGKPAQTPIRPLAVLLAGRMGVPLPDALALDLDLVRPFLRARLAHRRVLSGPSRLLCRREAFSSSADNHRDGASDPASGLLLCVGVGGYASPNFVVTRMLDEWGLSFDEVLMIGLENVRAIVSPDDLSEVSGAQGLAALVDSTGEVGASAALVLENLGLKSSENGVLFSVPTEQTCLVLPVAPGSGASTLAAMVQMTYSFVAERQHPLSERVFWSRHGVVHSLPMTAVAEGDSRRVHLEASGITEELLRLLGEVG